MNARLAVEANEQLVKELFESSKKVMKVRNCTHEEAIDYKVSVYEKYAKNGTEATAWYLRGQEAKKMIKNA